MVLNDIPLASMNFVSGISGSPASLTLPSSASAMGVPKLPGLVGIDLQILLDVLDGRLGVVADSMKARSA